MFNSPYLRLMRIHQPAGVLLLLWPCWWAIALASHGRPPLMLLGLFALGAFLMRSAGCIINDITDRKFDAAVERTKNRPLASGELSVAQAIILLTLLLIAALAVALTLGKTVVLWSVASLPLVILYPWMKRITWWPQFFLGLAFNWGALLGWVAVRGTIELPALLLYIGGIFWTLGYDTIYAHQDKKDDAEIGVKSSALRLGENSKRIIAIFYLAAIIFWTFDAWKTNCDTLTFSFLILGELHFAHQLCRVDFSNSGSCRRYFIVNATQLGPLIFLAFLA